MKIRNAATNFYTDHDLREYRLVVYPGSEINEQITEEKKIFWCTYHYETALKAKPHIVVAKFMIKEGMEETVVRWIQNICNLQNGFSVLLNNYSGFPPDTIYLRVQNDEPFKKLANALKILDGFIQSNGCPPLELISKPHLPIAKRLPECIYKTAINEYAEKTFHGSFKVEKLVLLKKDTQMKCHLINTFILPPLALPN
jgi:2'-5' RNA ligase